MECFERDAAHLWFNLYLISAYCLPSSTAVSPTNAPLRLLTPATTTTSFMKFTAFALESLCSELSGTSSTLIGSLPWGRQGEPGGEGNGVDVITSGPLEWSRTLSNAHHSKFVL